ncbi:MAG: EAL domain-containing protein [Thiogranum sp.]|nr:EAL domain-containing protein [Thiogranum sp.]
MTTPGQTSPQIRSGLPLKIAGIVFWGLVAVGVVIVAVSVNWLENGFSAHYSSVSNQAVLSIQAIVNQNPEATPARLRNQISAVIEQLDIPAATVERGIESVTVGTPASAHTSYTVSLPIQPVGTPTRSTNVLITLFRHPVSDILKHQKKRLLMIMGSLFFVFGLVLQWILQRVLTRPFLQMVNTAESCTRGKPVPFDEGRTDEFGYLSSFINQALRALKERQDELAHALDRAVASEHALFEEKERAEVTLNSIAEGVITTDRKGNVRFMNPAAERLSGWTQQEATGKHINEIVHLIDEHSGDHLESLALDCLRSGAVERSLEGRVLLNKDGAGIAVEELASPMRDHSRKTVGAVLVFDDIRQKKELTERLSYQASHDPLTGLYNRSEFERRVHLVLESAAAGETSQSALCYMDLDQFKIVNDTCGHIAGDELLRQLGHLLQSRIRESDTVARLGGDEFGVLLQGCSMQDAGRLAADLRKAIHDFNFWWEGTPFGVGASIGLVPLSSTTQSVTEALASADVACYAAKEHGRNQVHVYEPDDKELKRRRSEMQWVGQIRHALRENRFQLHLQPVAALAPSENHQQHGEILLRMQDEKGAVIAPGRFMGAAEQYGLMPAIDEWVLEHAFHWLATQVELTQSKIVVGINLSGQSLSSRTFLHKVVKMLDASAVPPEQVCFEITETTAIGNYEIALKFIRLFKGMGCRFAIDDFGSGMSSFAYLKQMPFDYLKIDGSYVTDLLRNPIDRALVEAANQIGHSMGMKTIAEFVEDPATLSALAEIGVDYAQGYAIGRPEPLSWPEESPASAIAAASPSSRLS